MDIFLILFFLFVKHCYVDFFIQTIEEVNGKGTYFNLQGIKHSVKQGLGTALVLNVCHVDPVLSAVLALIDFVIHYHIDWAKMNLNKYFNLDSSKPLYWNLLGLDQLLHNLTYVFFVWEIFSRV